MKLWETIFAGIFGRFKPPPPPPPRPPYVWPVAPPDSGGNPGLMLDILNEFRSQLRMQTLSPDAALTAWASGWAEQMLHAQKTGHASVAAIGAGIAALGYRWYTWSENVAGPWSDGTPTTPKEAFDLWLDSPPHRANIVNYAFTDVGIGYAKGYWCMTFGRKA